MAHNGWTRQFADAPRRKPAQPAVTYAPFAQEQISLEAPAYFKTEDPDADRMTYRELKGYIGELKASGYHVVPYQVQLQQKLAFPFVAIIMTLLAVPFAVTHRTERRDLRHRCRTGAGDRLSHGAQPVRRARQRRLGRSDARRMGAQHSLRRRGRLHAADGPDVTFAAATARQRCNAAVRIQIRPDVPGFVLFASTTTRTLRIDARSGRAGAVFPTAARSSKNTVRSCWTGSA